MHVYIDDPYHALDIAESIIRQAKNKIRDNDDVDIQIPLRGKLTESTED